MNGRKGNTKTEFENKDLAEFLEDAVQGLFDLDPNAIAIVAINDDRGIAGTQYYGCGVEDKGRMIHHINEDIVMDVILNNADTIRNILIDAENDEDETGDDDIERRNKVGGQTHYPPPGNPGQMSRLLLRISCGSQRMSVRGLLIVSVSVWEESQCEAV